MTYRGHVKNGVIVLDEPADLPEGMEVMVHSAQEAPIDKVEEPVPTLYEQLKEVIGITEGLPQDLAENHDHYLYGLPKK